MDFTSLGERSYSMTNLGLTIKLQCEAPADYDSSSPGVTESMNYWTAPIACGRGPSDLQRAPIILTLERKDGNIFRVNLERLELFSKMTRPPSPQFFTKILHISEVPRVSRFKINRALIDPSSDECLRRLRLRLSGGVRQRFQLTQIPRGFYEVPDANGPVQFFSSSHIHDIMSFEMSQYGNQILRLIFHGARNSTAGLEVCWIKKENSVYNSWLDFLDAPCTIIRPNQIRDINPPRGALQSDSPLTVTLRQISLKELSNERIWLIDLST